MKWTKRILSVLLTFSLLAATFLSGTPSVAKGAEEQTGTQTPNVLNCANYTNVAPLDINRTPKVQPFSAEQENDDNGIKKSKKVTDNKNGSYTLQLESYVTGKTTTIDKNKPTDTVLVLDVSGSMKDSMTVAKGKNCLDKLNPDFATQYKYNGRDMRYNKLTKKWQYGESSYSWCDCNPIWSTEITSTKLNILKNSVNEFIDLAAEKEGSHRISIVTFAYQAFVGKELVPAKENQAELKKIVNDLDADGATQSDYGMAKAKDIISKIPNDRDSEKVVIMFTDGVPTSGSQFENVVANRAIRHSKELKNNYNTTVYSIGVFKGADPSATETNIFGNIKPRGPFNQYMHGVSSNYPNANSFSNLGKLNEKADPFNNEKSYYLAANNAESLSEIFQSISDEIGGAAAELDETTVIKDVVSDYFELPDGADKSDIKVYTEDCKEFDQEGNPIFTNKQLYNNGKVKINGKEISVSGFDFSEHYVGRNESTNKVHEGAQKLIIEIPIVRSADFIGGNNVPTNTEDSGVYDNDGNLFEAFDVPTTDVDIKYEYGTKDQEIFLGDSANLEQCILINNVNGTNNKFVDIVYKVTDEKGTVVGTYTVKHEQSEGTWKWSNGSNPKLKEDTTYKVVCTVTPNPKGYIKPVEIEHGFKVSVVTGSLTISKEGGNTDEKYIFNIKKDDKTYMSVTVNGGDSVTVTHLPKGNYTVTEDVAWSWRWNCTFDDNTANINLDSPTKDLSFKNTLNNKKWLNDYDYKVNQRVGGAQ